MKIVLQPFQTIPAAAQTTGLSESELRRGCEGGTIPHVWTRGICFVNIPALWDEDEEKEEASGSGVCQYHRTMLGPHEYL